MYHHHFATITTISPPSPPFCHHHHHFATITTISPPSPPFHHHHHQSLAQRLDLTPLGSTRLSIIHFISHLLSLRHPSPHQSPTFQPTPFFNPPHHPSTLHSSTSPTHHEPSFTIHQSVADSEAPYVMMVRI